MKRTLSGLFLTFFAGLLFSLLSPAGTQGATITDTAQVGEILTNAVTTTVLARPSSSSPSAPIALTGALQNDESVDLDWDDSTGADSYQVSYRHAHESEWTTLPSGDSTVTFSGSSAKVSSLPYPLNYYFRVNASNSNGASDWSGELLVTPAPITGLDGCTVGTPPEHLSSFSKYCSAGGIGIVGSREVSDYAIKLAWNHVMNMLAAHPAVHRKMAEAKVHSVLKAASTPGSKASYADNTRQAASDEENLLCYPGEPRRGYAGWDAFNHEFGHALHRQGLTSSDFSEVRSAYQAAMNAGLWQDAYSSASDGEYFAEAVELYFSPRAPGSGETGNPWRTMTPVSTLFCSNISLSTTGERSARPGQTSLIHLQRRLSPLICGPRT